MLQSSYLSYTSTDLRFISQLTELIHRASVATNPSTKSLEPVTDSSEVPERGSPDSSSSYFEMGQDHSDDIMGCSSSKAPLEETETPNEEPSNPRIDLLVWCYCISAGRDEGLKQRTCCLAATDHALVLFQVPEEPPNTVEELMKEGEITLLVPYSDLKAFQIYVPDICMCFVLKSSDSRWFLFSDAQNVSKIWSHLDLVLENIHGNPDGPTNIHRFLQQFLNPWETDENGTAAKSGHLAHVLTSPSHAPESPPVPTDILSPMTDSSSIPLMLFLTPRHLCILKLDFTAPPGTDVHSDARSCARMTRIPLTSVLLHPRPTSQSGSDGHDFCRAHVLEIMAGHGRLAVIFTLSHDKFRFLREFRHFRSRLRDIKSLAVLTTGQSQRSADSQTAKNHQKYKEIV